MPSEATVAAVHLKTNQKFLFSLFDVNKDNRRKRFSIITEATTAQIAVLIKVLYLIWTGEIPVRKRHLEQIKKSKKVPHISKHFGNRDSYLALKGKTVQEQKEILANISTWHELLYNLFKKSRNAN